MARYIAGFSPEARKSGPFCRPPAIKPGGCTCKSGVEELEFSSARQFGTKLGVEVQYCTKPKLWWERACNEQNPAELARRGRLMEFSDAP
jgi:hypothetical protein